MNRFRVRTASRLHFGLLGWGPRAVRQFGGVGLMIESPGVEVIAEPASQWSFEGPLADRVRNIALEAADQLSRSEAENRVERTPLRLQVVTSPPEHVGLGVGTQLSLAVARAVLELTRPELPTAECLARLSGRGRRSGIGLHGFLCGGLIVDGGRRDEVHPPPLVAHLPFPEDWSVLTIRPPGPRGRFGADESQAFAELPPVLDSITDQLCRLVLLGILPAVADHDFPAFGTALHELQLKVGESFAAVQGGVFSSPRSDAIIAGLRRMGLAGAGQSSWGPTLFAFGCPSDFEQNRITAWLIDQFHLDPTAVSWTRAVNHGALTDWLTS